MYSKCINRFLADVPILYPLKTPENQRFSGVFRGYKMGTLARNALKTSFDKTISYDKRPYEKQSIQISFVLVEKLLSGKVEQASLLNFV